MTKSFVLGEKEKKEKKRERDKRKDAAFKIKTKQNRLCEVGGMNIEDIEKA